MEFKEMSLENQERVAALRQAVCGGADLCYERGKYFTESFKATEGKPYAYRKAAALAHTLKSKAKHIYPEELIVCSMTSMRKGAVLMPDVNSPWMVDMAETLEKENDPNKAELTKTMREMADYWPGQCLYSRWLAEIPKEAEEIAEVCLGGMAYCANGQNFGHFALDFALVLKKGIKGFLADIEEAQKKNCTDLGDPAQWEKHCLYEDMKLELNALIDYAHEYSDLAKKMAETEECPKRKAELLKIADACAWVPENTPRDFQEALQAQAFIFDALQTETYSHAVSLGRVDQTFYPYYKMSRDNGMTQEEAFVLYSSFISKMASTTQCPPSAGGFSMFGQKNISSGGGYGVITIGGTDREGNCAVNELSYLILDVERYWRFSNDVMVRINKNTPTDFLVKALKLSRDLSGKAKYLGDACIMNQMKAFGRPEGEIGNYCVVGCTSPALPSYSLDVAGGIINLPLFLDLALHDGYSTVMQKQMGPHTGDPRNFTKWEDVFDAYKAQYEYQLPYMHILSNIDKKNNGLYNPHVFASSLYPPCIEAGTDLYRGALGKLTSYAFSLGGGPNVGDSLAALRKVVFEDKTLTMAQVIDACDNNFEGEEGKRIHTILDAAPKYGNDIDYVDNMVAEVMAWTSDATCAAPGEWGSTTTVAGAAVALNVALGGKVGATPDGRYRSEPFSEGGLSPSQGKNTSGITATMNSLLKMPHLKLHHGEVLNVRMDPNTIGTDDKIEKLAMMVKSFLVSGGALIQFNIVSTDTLRKAQAHPEEYADLLVRVATYSAYFVGLHKGLQDDIINRMEVSLN